MFRRTLRTRPWLTGLAMVLLTGLFCVLLVWLFRFTLAEHLTKSWCRSKALSCELEIDGLGLSGAKIKAIRLSNAAAETPFEAGDVKVDIGWAGLFSPVVKRVEMTDPVIRLVYTSEGNLSVGGLETLAASGDKNSQMQLPEIQIRNARIEAETPAGAIVMHGRVSGKLPYQGELHARIEPADLQSDSGQIKLSEGRVDLTLAGMKLAGSAHFQLTRADFEGASARDVLVEASMADTLRPQVNWSASIGSLVSPDIEMKDGNLSGSVGLTLGDQPDAAGPLSRIRSLSLQGETDRLRWTELSATHASLTLDTMREGGSDLSGKFGLKLDAFSHPSYATGRLVLSGTGTVSDDLGEIDLEGGIIADNAVVPPPQRAALLSVIRPAPPFAGHASVLKSGLSQLLSGFKAGTGYRVRKRASNDWSLVTTRTVSLTGDNGAVFALKTDATRPAINISDEGVELQGVLTLDGPDLPALAADIEGLRVGPQGVDLKAGGLSMQPWTASGLTIGADLNELKVDIVEGTTHIKSVGEVTLEGDLFGQSFSKTRLFGGIEAAAGETLLVQSYSTRCLGINSSGVTATGGLTIAPFKLQLCPPGGRLVRRTNGALNGTLSVSDLNMPFQTDDTSGTLRLENGMLDWRATSVASINVNAAHMGLDLEFGDNSLGISATSPKLGFQTTTPLTLSADTGRTEFTGSLIPASISVGSTSFEATLPDTGLTGSATASQVEVRDPNDDPLYQPLTGELAASFGNGLMQLSGPVTTARAGQTVADVNLTLDLVKLNGEASISTPDLVFMPGGLQPTALSERIRGFLSNARGQLNAGANFLIDGGSVTGTGFVSVDDFGFDTLRVGAVDGVSGSVNFDDILTLHTPPGQEFHLGAINPGIPLNDGVINFQMLSATNAIIEQARWPFAGGELVVGRSEWTIAGTRDIIEIAAKQLELSEIIGVFKLPDVKADGTVSGRFPVELIGPNTYIRDAVLTADSKGGTIAYTGDIADAASQADDRVDLAFEALKDFQFSVLEVGATGNLSGDILVTLNLVGKSPTVLGGAPFAFNIGVDSQLMKLIRTGRSVTTTDWLAEVTRQAGDDTPADDPAVEPDPQTN